jgi:hypothetical protein
LPLHTLDFYLVLFKTEWGCFGRDSLYFHLMCNRKHL